MIRTTAINPRIIAATAYDVIEKLPFDFYLTGSRFFGTHREDSDWDFIAGEGVIEALETNGFKRHLDGEAAYRYGDAAILAVYRRDNVDVQIMVSVVALVRRIEVLNAAKRCGIAPPTNKKKRAQWWTFMQNYYGAIEVVVKNSVRI